MAYPEAGERGRGKKSAVCASLRSVLCVAVLNADNELLGVLPQDTLRLIRRCSRAPKERSSPANDPEFRGMSA